MGGQGKNPRVQESLLHTLEKDTKPQMTSPVYDVENDNAIDSTEEKHGGPTPKVRGSKGLFFSHDESASSSLREIREEEEENKGGPSTTLNAATTFDASGSTPQQRKQNPSTSSRGISGEKSESGVNELQSPAVLFTATYSGITPSNGGSKPEHKNSDKTNDGTPLSKNPFADKAGIEGGQGCCDWCPKFVTKRGKPNKNPPTHEFNGEEQVPRSGFDASNQQPITTTRSGHNQQNQQPPSGSQEQHQRPLGQDQQPPSGSQEQHQRPHGQPPSGSQEQEQPLGRQQQQQQQPPSGSQEQEQPLGKQQQQEATGRVQPKKRKFWKRSGHKQDQQPPSSSQEQQQGQGQGQGQARGGQERQQVSKKRKFWKLCHSNNNNSAILPITNKPPIKKESMEIFDIALKLLKFVGPVTTVTWFYFHSSFNMMESLENEHMGFNKKIIISVVVALVAVTIALALIFAIFIILMKTVLFFFSLLLLVLLFL